MPGRPQSAVSSAHPSPYDAFAAESAPLNTHLQPSPPPHSATTSARQSGCKIRPDIRNWAKTLRPQFGKKYDVKKVRNSSLRQRHVPVFDSTLGEGLLDLPASPRCPTGALRTRSSARRREAVPAPIKISGTFSAMVGSETLFSSRRRLHRPVGRPVEHPSHASGSSIPTLRIKSRSFSTRSGRPRAQTALSHPPPGP